MKDFKKYYIIPADPVEVYAALTNPATLELWTGAPAQMSTEIGSEFSIMDDSIVGKNLDFVDGKIIVQQWYFEEDEEPSIVTILLHEHKNGTSAELRHINIPNNEYDAIVEGWNDIYFGGLIRFYL